MAKALYICYFGLRQPLVQTQVLPYLRELLKDEHEITLLTFEPDFRQQWTAKQIVEEQERMRDSGIEWRCLAYHKWPSAIATAYDIINGAWHIRGVLERKQIDILHGRVHVPTLMGAIARKFSRRKPKLLFDIRGFFPEEYTDAGIWTEDGILYRSVKKVERWLMKETDGFVVLTEKAREILFPESKIVSSDSGSKNSPAYAAGTDLRGRPVEVIPCCVDLEGRFAIDREALRTKLRRELGIEKRFVFVHAGVLGGLYLTSEIADFLEVARERDPETFALFLTQSDPDLLVPLLREKGFADSDYFVAKVSPSEIPGYLCAADAGLSFVKAGYATQSRSPTKIPEYLACGLPIVANTGVGDVDALVEKNRVGVILREFSRGDYLAALSELGALDCVEVRSRRTAVNDFDLQNIGGKRYLRLYNSLSAEKDAR